MVKKQLYIFENEVFSGVIIINPLALGSTALQNESFDIDFNDVQRKLESFYDCNIFNNSI